MTVKLVTFTVISSVCPQCDQHTKTIVHALIDCQSVGPSWVNVLRFISGQVSPMSDADAISQLRFPIDTRTYQSTKPVLSIFACGLCSTSYSHLSYLRRCTTVDTHSYGQVVLYSRGNCKRNTANSHHLWQFGTFPTYPDNVSCSMTG
jgi:hypothetical protein